MNQQYYQSLYIQQQQILQQAQNQNINSLEAQMTNKEQDSSSPFTVSSCAGQSSQSSSILPTSSGTVAIASTTAAVAAATTTTTTTTAAAATTSSITTSTSTTSDKSESEGGDKNISTKSSVNEHQHLSIQHPSVFHTSNPTNPLPNTSMPPPNSMPLPPNSMPPPPNSMPPPLPMHGGHPYPYPPHHLQSPMMYGYPPHFPPHAGTMPPTMHPLLPAHVPTSSSDKIGFPLSASKQQIPQKFQNRSSPPFRIGGRGSRQLSKALEEAKQQLVDPQNQQDAQFVICMADPPCFAKAITQIQESSSVLIQPLIPSTTADAALLAPWEGHIWLAKADKLHSIKMKQEPGGWRIIQTPKVMKFIEMLRAKGGTFSMPMTLNTAVQSGKKDWDMVSLESSDFDDGSSVDSLFGNLGKDLNVKVNRSRSPSPSASNLPVTTTNISNTTSSNNTSITSSPLRGNKNVSVEQSPHFRMLTSPHEKSNKLLLLLQSSKGNEKDQNGSTVDDNKTQSNVDLFQFDSSNNDNNSLEDFADQMREEFGDGFNSDMFDDFNTFNTSTTVTKDTPKRVKIISRDPKFSDNSANKSSPSKSSVNKEATTSSSSQLPDKSTKDSVSKSSVKMTVSNEKSNQSKHQSETKTSTDLADKSFQLNKYNDSNDEVDSDTTPKQLPKHTTKPGTNDKKESKPKLPVETDDSGSEIDTDTTPKQLPKVKKADATKKETSFEKSWKNITPKCECGKTYALPQGLYNHRKTCKLWKGHQHILNSSVSCVLPTGPKTGKLSNEESNEEVESAKRKVVEDSEENDKKKSKVDKQPQQAVGAKELKGIGLEPSSQSSKAKQSSQSSTTSSSKPSSSKPSQSKPKDKEYTQRDDDSKQRNSNEVSMREIKNLMGADAILPSRRSVESDDKQMKDAVVVPAPVKVAATSASSKQVEPSIKVSASAPKRPSMGAKELKGLGLMETSSESRRKESSQSSASEAKAASSSSSTKLSYSKADIPTQRQSDGKPKMSRTSNTDISLRELQNLISGATELVTTSRRLGSTSSVKPPDTVVTAKSSQPDVSNPKEPNLKPNTTKKETSFEKSWENITPKCECGKTYALPQGLYNHRKTCKLWKGHQHILNSSLSCVLPTGPKTGKLSNEESNEEVESAKRKVAEDSEENDKKKSKVDKQPRQAVGAKELKGIGLEPSSQSSKAKQSSQSSTTSSSKPSSSKPSQSKPKDKASTKTNTTTTISTKSSQSSNASSSKASQSKPKESNKKENDSKRRNPSEISMREIKNLMGADAVLPSRRK